MEQTSSRLRT